MEQQQIFSATLGLSLPWEMTAVSISMVEKRIDFTVDFVKDNVVTCPCCGAAGKTCDVECETWINRNYLGHIAYLHARVPYIACICCGTKRVEPPWTGAGFTLIM